MLQIRQQPYFLLLKLMLLTSILPVLTSCQQVQLTETNPIETGTTNTATNHYAVLFDAYHAQTAGNADWIISTSIPDPLAEDSNPQHEEDWTGGFSAWGVALQQSGNYMLKTNNRAFTYKNQNNPLDLSNFHALIIPEPNTRFTSSEKSAIIDFVRDGGGLFMIADHIRSDRNNDGYDSPVIFNELMNTNGTGRNLFGIQFDTSDISYENVRNISTSSETEPILDGAYGQVKGTIIRSGTTITLSPTTNPDARGVIYRNNVSNKGNKGVFVALSEYGDGRIVAIGDSSPADDGTCTPRNRCHDGWNDSAGQNAALFPNATAWLVSTGEF